jgi:hypothetical protein
MKKSELKALIKEASTKNIHEAKEFGHRLFSGEKNPIDDVLKNGFITVFGKDEEWTDIAVKALKKNGLIFERTNEVEIRISLESLIRKSLIDNIGGYDGFL